MTGAPEGLICELRTRTEGPLILAELVPTNVLADAAGNAPTPVLIGSIALAVCEATGGPTSKLFEKFVQVMTEAGAVAVMAASREVESVTVRELPNEPTH